jgi:hypothetical protein
MASWRRACSSSAALISSSDIGSAMRMLIASKASSLPLIAAQTLLDVPAHVLRGIERGLLLQKADTQFGCGRASPSISVSTPAMIRRRVDLPAPFRPSTPIFAPGKKLSEMSRSR